MIETPSFSIERGAIVPVTKVSARKKQEVSDILTWVECFTSYLAVVSNSFPARTRDLLAYMALVIRMAKRYSGRCWSNYDRAFHLEAAASNLRDWSQMKADLYSYHTSVDTSNKTVAPQRAQHREPRGTAAPTEKSTAETIAIVPQQIVTAHVERYPNNHVFAPPLCLIEKLPEAQVVSPINLTIFELHLKAHPDRRKVDYVLNGHRYGF